MSADEHRFKSLRGNEGWHTDSSYMPLAAKASVLSAQVVPSAAGETEWADMRAAYEALDEATRRRIAGLSAHHSLYHSQAKTGHVVQPGAGYGFHTKGAPLRPLVKVHPVTGRPALFIGRHAYGIPGLAEAESEKLLSDLVDFACRPPRTYAHRWQPGDVVIWDNRCVLHRARPYDYREVRVMRHTRVAGDPATGARSDASRRSGRRVRAFDLKPIATRIARASRTTPAGRPRRKALDVWLTTLQPCFLPAVDAKYSQWKRNVTSCEDRLSLTSIPRRILGCLPFPGHRSTASTKGSRIYGHLIRRAQRPARKRIQAGGQRVDPAPADSRRRRERSAPWRIAVNVLESPEGRYDLGSKQYGPEQALRLYTKNGALIHERALSAPQALRVRASLRARHRHRRRGLPSAVTGRAEAACARPRRALATRWRIA